MGYQRAWMQLQDFSPAYLVPSYAKRGTENWKDKELTLVFPFDCGELEAISLNQKFKITPELRSTTMLQVQARQTTAKAIDSQGGSGYKINRLSTDSGAAAYVKKAGGDGTPLKIMAVGQVRGDNQICMEAGGIVTISANLIGKKIMIANVPVVYEDIAMVDNENELGKVKLFIVDKAKQTKKFQLITYDGCIVKRGTFQGNQKEKIIKFDTADAIRQEVELV